MDNKEPEIKIMPITAEEARVIRKAVLRPDQPAKFTIYPNDDASGTLHVGAFIDGQLVGITTVSLESPPGEHKPDAWRMRGVAVIGNWRRLAWIMSSETTASLCGRTGAPLP